jgi:addiction module RelE/StbE family toxin
MNTNPVILYSKRFDRDFNEILRYLRQNFSESAANVVLDKVFDTIEELIENPERYPPEPQLSHLGNYRVIRLKKSPYKIFYNYTGSEIRILRIFHSKRDFNRIFKRYKF